MNILITGASGFIGRHFIQFYPEHQYTVLTRSPKNLAKQVDADVKVLTSLSELKHLDDYDAVINLAGEPIIDKRWTQKQRQRICQSRWQITQDLVDLIAASSNPPSVLVNGSAIGFYGPCGSARLTENDDVVTKDFGHEVCKGWEDIALTAQDKTRVALLRIGIVLGKGGPLAKMIMPFKFGVGGRIGDGRQYMSWVHIEDMCRAIDYLLLNKNAQGPYNITAPKAETNGDFSDVLAGVMGTKARLPVPEFMLRLLLGEAADLALSSQNIYPEKLLNSGFEFKFNSLPNALVDLV